MSVCHRVPSRVLHEGADMRPSVPPLSQRPERFPAADPSGAPVTPSVGRRDKSRQPLSRASLALRGPSRLRVSGAVAPSAPGRQVDQDLSRAASSECGSRQNPRRHSWSQNGRSSIRPLAATEGRSRRSASADTFGCFGLLGSVRPAARRRRRRRRLDYRNRRLAAHRIPFADVEADIEDVVAVLSRRGHQDLLHLREDGRPGRGNRDIERSSPRW